MMYLGQHQATAGRLKGVLPVVLAAAGALVLQMAPALGEWAQLDRSALLLHQPFQILGSHWAHWSWSHLGWDLLVFIGLGLACFRRFFRRTLFALGASSILIAFIFWWLHTDLHSYRGLSGLDSTLFGLFLAAWWVDARRAGHGKDLVFLACVGTAFTAKLVYEGWAGVPVFVRDVEMQALPWVHLGGMLTGLVFGGWRQGTVGKAEHGQVIHTLGG
jgi:membrane associated rhomboid family serine protease